MTDNQIVLSGVEKHYGSYHALRDINLTIEKGSFVALVGPSGCGKSTLLRSLAGLEKISSGSMSIAGRDMTNVAPRKRDIAMVFQSYALYPHMTVEQNLTYSLRMKGVSKTARAEAARKAADTIGLTELLHRMPRELSGGQRQRVAMGRAIIRNPKAFLFDEPLSNLDAALRVHMRKEIRALHDRLGATSVYVTHDQVEAMTMADKVVVLRAGKIEQQGTPVELYDRPANRFVAGFIGSPAMNFIGGVLVEGGRAVQLDLPGSPVISITPRGGSGPIVLGVRPEHIQVGGAVSSGFQLPVKAIEFTGSNTNVTLGAETEIVVSTASRPTLVTGQPVSVTFEAERVAIFDPLSGVAL